MFYSQFGEDQLLSNYFNDDYIGVCVEVGAYDGITCSNTYHFENRGWETLCIEPIPEAFNKCALIRKKCINCCVSNYESENIDYFVVRVNGDNTSAISSLNIDERLIVSHKHMINNVEKITVNVKTLNNIFKETNFPKIIDFISIDTGNTELDVLKGINFDEYDIKFLVIENNFDEPQVEDYLKTKNFTKLFRNSVNDFYVNKQYKLVFDKSNELHCGKTQPHLLNNIGCTIEASIGDIIDKFSILELKQKYITNINQLSEIQKELDVLSNFIKDSDTFFYNLLFHINELIWIDTDLIKKLSFNNKEYNNIYLFAEISNRIFENNQKRFRLKTYFNVLGKSNIKEQKSYKNDVCYIDIKDENEIYSKIAEINYLLISYDIIYVNNEYHVVFKQLFKNPNICFTEQKDNYEKYYKLEAFVIDQNIRKIYELEPIKYISGGRLGDFLNQLSVVAENYYKTGKKGVIFIIDAGDHFSNGLENTYNDTFETIMNQEYINSYKIYNNEVFDIDLTSWRSNVSGIYSNKNWKFLFSTHYKIDWGKHKWIHTTFNSEWENKIIINNTYYEPLSEKSINTLREVINNNKDNCVFISNDFESYHRFLQIIDIAIEYYKPSNFSDLVRIVNSSKIAYVGFSAIAVISNALHKQHVLTGSDNWRYEHNNLKGDIPHVLDILV